MKQVLIKKGRPIVANVPSPESRPGFLLVRIHASCVSPGTEMAGIAKSGKSLIQRAIEQPDKAKAAISQMRSKGIAAVWKQSKEKFDREAECGYSAAGVIVDLGEQCPGFTKGMRVAVAGAGIANHAEMAAIPVNLAVPIPDDVDDEQASTVAIGAIAMQAVRRASTSIGEKIAVIGCGPLGLLAIQMLHASGCRVFATDIDQTRLAMARDSGAEVACSPAHEDVVAKANHWSGGFGVDAVIVFTATNSGEPLSQAFRMSRRKGRVVLAGVAGGEYKRDEMYAKELDFLISTSYGPGRYDEDYEIHGKDYPHAYVRWTENRNMAAYLDLISQKRVNVSQMIGIREHVDLAESVYERLNAPDRPLLAVLQYDTAGANDDHDTPALQAKAEGWKPVPEGTPLNIAIVGPGSFVRATHIPILASMPERFSIPWCVSKTGASAYSCARTIPGCHAESDLTKVLADDKLHAVMIGTRHDSHCRFATEALRAGKAVFVEKPMCLQAEEFTELEAALELTDAPFMVGYNRRYSPFADRIRELTADRVHPLMIHYTMNAGYLPREHWTHGPEGGGRLMGEACHIIDLFRSLVGHPAASIHCAPLGIKNPAAFPTDNFSLTITYQDGSVAHLTYTAMGHSSIPKERMDIHFDGKSIVLDDYLSLSVKGITKGGIHLKSQDKGHAAELLAFRQAANSTGNRFPIPWEELAETWHISWQANQQCLKGDPDHP